jgi:ATP/maltotriose-dependent transcriptional regulator MalT
MLAALRGDQDAAEARVAEVEQVVLPLGVSALLANVQLVRGVTTLTGGRYADAYAHLRRMFDPADAAFHPIERFDGIAYFVDAAVHSGNREEARALLQDVEAAAAQTPSPAIHQRLRYARPVLAGDEDAEALFLEALRAEQTLWPFLRAGLQLAYGEWLRRQRRVAESRAPLRAARDAFDVLGVIPWGERARRELHAAGESSRRRTPTAREQLTPQELQIAQIAAEGLSNREIGQQLFLSPRTVSTHLYRIFPKLGISSRSELGRVLSAAALSGS